MKCYADTTRKGGEKLVSRQSAGVLREGAAAVTLRARDWCETADLKLRWAELDFLRWLYSPMNSKYSKSPYNTKKEG